MGDDERSVLRVNEANRLVTGLVLLGVAIEQIVGPEPRAACFASSAVRLSCSVAPWPGQLKRYPPFTNMGKMTPSAAKNAIRRALLGIVDPYPNATQIHRIWAFFDSACAYCGRSLVRGDRDAHIDHLVAPGAGGSNALANFVLSCGFCNGDEKRDENWESFLRRKAPDDTAYNLRRNRIETWVANCSDDSALDSSVTSAVNREIERAIAAFDVSLENVRALKQRGG